MGPRHLTTANLGFSRIPGVTANSALSKTHTRQIVLPAYVETQRNLLPEADKVVNPNTNRDDLSMNQDLTMKAPTSWWGIGGDELRLEGNFTENKVIFDQEAVTDANLAYKNTERRTRTLKGRYSGSYKAGGWLTVSPSYAYTLVEGEGNIPIPTVLNGQAYYTLNGQRESEGWIPQSRVINPSLQLQFGDLGIIRSPRTVYNFTQTRDYIRNDLRTPGSLALNGALNLAGLGQGFEKLPSVDMSQTWSVDSDINNDVRVRSVQRAGALDRWLSSNTDFGGRYGGVANQNLPNIALQEQQSPLQSVWWVRIDDLGLGENVTDPLNIENLAITATRRSNTSFNTRFDMPVLPSWTGTFSPRLTLLDERTMSAPEQVVRRAQFTVGSGLEFKEPHIPFWGSLKPSSLTLDYSYSSSDNFLVSLTTDGTGTKEDLSNNSVSHNFTSTLPMRPTDRTALTVSLRWTGTGESNYIAGAVGPTSQRGTWELGPAIKLVYFLNVDKPVKLWDMWPFYGRELRIKQSFRLDNDLTLVMHRESQTLTTNSLPETGSDVYGLRNQIGYNVLDNVKMNFIIDERYNHDIHGVEAVNQGGDYYSIKLELGLEATF